MTTLHLVAAPTRFRHRPTEIEAMRFTASTRQSVEAWLNAELGRGKFDIRGDFIVIETTQGDSRFAGYGCWVIKRATRDGFEFYPVENEVIADGYEQVPA